MMKKKVYRRYFYLVLVVLLVPFYGCGGGGGGGDSTIVPITPPDVAALWTVTETSVTNSCESSAGVHIYDIFVSQAGTAMTVYTPAGTFSGSIAGDTASWTGSYPEDGGTTTITAMNLSVNPSADSLGGSVDWTWTDGTSSCAGTTAMAATKHVAPPPPPAALDVAGVWAVVDTVGENTCGDPVSVENYNITINQVGTDITAVTPAGTFNGTLTGNILEWTGSHPDQTGPGITTMTLMYLIVNDTATSFSGPVFWTWTDGSFTCAGVSDTASTKL